KIRDLAVRDLRPLYRSRGEAEVAKAIENADDDGHHRDQPEILRKEKPGEDSDRGRAHEHVGRIAGGHENGTTDGLPLQVGTNGIGSREGREAGGTHAWEVASRESWHSSRRRLFFGRAHPATITWMQSDALAARPMTRFTRRLPAPRARRGTQYERFPPTPSWRGHGGWRML